MMTVVATSLRKLCIGLTAGAALLLAAATPGTATVYQTLADWNAAAALAGSDQFAITSPAISFQFFGACSISAKAPCKSTDGDNTTPIGSNSPGDTAKYINDYSNFSKDVSIVADLPIGSVGTAGTLTSAIAYALWVLKFDNALIALLFSAPVNSITFSGLEQDLSHLYLGLPGPPSNNNPVPLPPAVLLFGSALVGLGYLNIRRRRRAA